MLHYYIMLQYSQIAFLFLSFVGLFKHIESHRPVKLTLIFDEFQYGNKRAKTPPTFLEKQVVFLSSSSLFVDHDISPRVIEKKIRKLPSFYWGCSVVKFLRIDHVQRGHKHVIVNILRKDCMLLPKLYDRTNKLHLTPEVNQNSEINRQYQIGGTKHKSIRKKIDVEHGDRKEDHPSARQKIDHSPNGNVQYNARSASYPGVRGRQDSLQPVPRFYRPEGPHPCQPLQRHEPICSTPRN
mgnify:CR=1 FL=1